MREPCDSLVLLGIFLIFPIQNQMNYTERNLPLRHLRMGTWNSTATVYVFKCITRSKFSNEPGHYLVKFNHFRIFSGRNLFGSSGWISAHSSVYNSELFDSLCLLCLWFKSFPVDWYSATICM